jgi:FkbM family methyltransferase
MHPVERLCLSLRHHSPLARVEWLWWLLRPWYDHAVKLTGRRGIERIINGTDPLFVLPQYRHVSETYEPAMWTHLITRLRPDDTVADVGAFIGLYTVAIAKRLPKGGKVIACEPDPKNAAVLKGHVALNRVADRVEIIEAVVSERIGEALFQSGEESQSRVSAEPTDNATMIASITLDRIFADRPLDVVKIDVEGHEEAVLRGASCVLQSRERAPRIIYIEVHPYAWATLGTSSASLLGFLRGCGYEVTTLGGQPVAQIHTYGEIIARRVRPRFSE